MKSLAERILNARLLSEPNLLKSKVSVLGTGTPSGVSGWGGLGGQNFSCLNLVSNFGSRGMPTNRTL